jgi:hypothetical protein
LFFVCSIGCLVCYPQVQDISNSKFIKLEVSASSSEKTFVLDINLYFTDSAFADPIDKKDEDPNDPIDPVGSKDEFCYATCDEVMELVDVDMPINDLKEKEGVKSDVAGTIIDGGQSRTTTDNI